MARPGSSVLPAAVLVVCLLLPLAVYGTYHIGCPPGKWGNVCEKDCDCETDRICACHTANGTLCDMKCVRKKVFVAAVGPAWASTILAIIMAIIFGALTAVTILLYSKFTPEEMADPREPQPATAATSSPPTLVVAAPSSERHMSASTDILGHPATPATPATSTPATSTPATSTPATSTSTTAVSSKLASSHSVPGSPGESAVH